MPSAITSIKEFLKVESAGGIVMIGFAVLAMLCANILPNFYFKFIHLHIIAGDIKFWVDDVLMVLFFFVIGMELKREAKEGFLQDRKQILMPVVAAFFGMAVPALIFFALNSNSKANMPGWAIPCATDIAFAVAVLSIFAKRFPPSVKIFLLALAIFDDIGAILVIALYYNEGIAFEPFLFVMIACVALYILNRFKIAQLWYYLTAGIFLWFFMYASGIHTTLAGVILGLAIPMQQEGTNHSPLKFMIHKLHPFVNFVVLPLFAFISAGVYLGHIKGADMFENLPLGIVLGLFAGKQIGIFVPVWLMVKGGIVKMPEGAKWIHIYAAAVIAGVGFTMSLFIGTLAFGDTYTMELARIGIIAGSLLSAIWGAVVLKLVKD